MLETFILVSFRNVSVCQGISRLSRCLDVMQMIILYVLGIDPGNLVHPQP